MHRMRAALQTRMNLEMAATDEMIAIARAGAAAGRAAWCRRSAPRSRPRAGSTWPGSRRACRDCCAALRECGIRVSLFIDPDPAQIEAALEIGAPVVELHTGAYADATGERQAIELMRLVRRRARIGVADRPDGARRPRPALPQRAAGRGDRRRSSS